MMTLERSKTFLLALALSCASAWGQGEETTEVPTAAELRAQLEEVQAGELPEKEELTRVLGQSLQELDRAKVLERRAQEFERQKAEAPALLESIRAELALPPEREDPKLPPEATLRELEQLQQQAEADRSFAQKLVDDLAGETTHRSERLASLGDEVARTRSSISEKETQLRAAGAGDAVAIARRNQLLVELEALRMEERALTSERETYETRRELLPLRRDQAQRQLTRAEYVVGFWRQVAATRRQQEADEAAREAERQRRQTAARFPALSEIAKRNEELASMRSGSEGLPAQMSRASDALQSDRQTRDETLRRSRSTRRKIQVGGLTEGMGLLLRREFEWTRTPESLVGSSESRKEQLSRAQLLQITLQEEREAVGDLAIKHEELMAELAVQAAGRELEQLSALAKELLSSQRALHDSMIDELGTLIGTLIEHERVHEELAEATLSYRSYIEERILWVRSNVGGLVPHPNDFVGGLRWLTSRSAWEAALNKCLASVLHRPARVTFSLLIVLVLVALRIRVRRRLLSIADLIRSYRTDRYALTNQAIVLTLLLALPLPLLVWTMGVVLTSPADQLEVARTVGIGLRGVAFSYFALEFLRQAVREKHIGGPHFRWPASSMAALQTELRWFMLIFLPLELVTLTFDLQETPAFSDSVGRLAFILELTAVAVILFRLFRPSGKILSSYFQRTNGLLERTYRIWFVPAVGVPITLAGLALLGYYYSALQFQSRLRDSIGLALALLLVNALMLRWLYIARRRLAVEQARQRSQAKAQAADAGDPAAASRESTKPLLDEESVDIPAVDIQTRKLIRSGIAFTTFLGLFFIWAGAFPALRALDNVQLWPTIQILDAEEQSLDEAGAVASGGASTTGTPNGAVSTTPLAVPGSPTGTLVSETSSPASDESGGEGSHLPDVITLADLILALVIFSLTFVATKNAPGVLEITVLQRLPLDSGARYALATLFRYLIVFFGLSLGFGAIGIGWSKIQWLAAALTFGLAFGLQEIFANFVSGIIILLERPVRVGDIVTVGEVEGRVTKLRMRATTILDWNRRELLVPNKEFITGNVINWTLSDPVTRIVLPVGIAYGSDTRLAHELLLKAARDCSLVLKDPAPMAVFRSFGESSLDFELRVFLADRDLWPEVTDQLHMGIDDEFRAAGIEISFPQRDLHIRSAPGLEGVIGMAVPEGER